MLLWIVNADRMRFELRSSSLKWGMDVTRFFFSDSFFLLNSVFITAWNRQKQNLVSSLRTQFFFLRLLDAEHITRFQNMPAEINTHTMQCTLHIFVCDTTYSTLKIKAHEKHSRCCVSIRWADISRATARLLYTSDGVQILHNDSL